MPEGTKIPVNIVSGFLGSGKTTAILSLLREKQEEGRWAVLINEFGEVSVDQTTVQSAASARETIVELAGGCICCSAKGMFRQRLEQLAREGNYARILIEPSGLGGIDLVSETVLDMPELELLPTACLIDLTGIEHPRLQMNPVYRMQIQKADVLIFTKTDLVPDPGEQQRLIGKVTSNFPGKPHWLSGVAKGEPISLPGMKEPDNSLHPQFKLAPELHPEPGDEHYRKECLTWPAETTFDLEGLLTFLNEQKDLIRAKGYIQTANAWKLLNFTLTGCTVEECDKKSQNQLVLIFDKQPLVTSQHIRAALQSVILSDHSVQETQAWA